MGNEIFEADAAQLAKRAGVVFGLLIGEAVDSLVAGKWDQADNLGGGIYHPGERSWQSRNFPESVLYESRGYWMGVRMLGVRLIFRHAGILPMSM